MFEFFLNHGNFGNIFREIFAIFAAEKKLKVFLSCRYEKRNLRNLFRITDCFFKNKIDVKLNALIQNIFKITIKFGKKLYDIIKINFK